MALLLGSGTWYVHTLNARTEKLLLANTELTAKLRVESTNLELCSDNTGKLKSDVRTSTENLQKSILEAQNATVANKKLAQDLRNAQAKAPVITPENRDQFGPIDSMDQLKDYNASHKLINDYILKINE